MSCLEERNIINDKLKLELSAVCTEKKEKVLELKAAKGEAVKMMKELRLEKNRLAELQTKVDVMIPTKLWLELRLQALIHASSFMRKWWTTEQLPPVQPLNIYKINKNNRHVDSG